MAYPVCFRSESISGVRGVLGLPSIEPENAPASDLTAGKSSEADIDLTPKATSCSSRSSTSCSRRGDKKADSGGVGPRPVGGGDADRPDGPSGGVSYRSGDGDANTILMRSSSSSLASPWLFLRGSAPSLSLLSSSSSSFPTKSSSSSSL